MNNIRNEFIIKLNKLAVLFASIHVILSCNPNNEMGHEELYQQILSLKSLEAACGASHTLILLDATLQGSVTHEGWKYYKFQAPTESDAVITLTPGASSYDVDLAVGFVNHAIGSSIPTDINCTGWEKCSANPTGLPDIIQPLHLKQTDYRCIGVYGRSCLSGSCNYTINVSWNLKP